MVWQNKKRSWQIKVQLFSYFMQWIVFSFYGDSNGKSGLDGKKIESLLNVSLDTSSKLEHNKIVVFEKKKINLNLALFSALKGEGGSDNKCHLKIEVSLVSCFQ